MQKSVKIKKHNIDMLLTSIYVIFWMEETWKQVSMHWQLDKIPTMSELLQESEFSFEHGPQNLKDTFRHPLVQHPNLGWS